LPEDADDKATAAASATAAQLAGRLRSGEAMQQLLKGRDQSAVQGGDLGWRRADELPSLFADKVPSLRPGQVSEPIRSPSGFHVLQLVEVRGTGQVIQQTRASHILLKASAIRSEEQTQALAAELRRRAQAGESFADLARQYSEDI